jgi:hypothetical protein
MLNNDQKYKTIISLWKGGGEPAPEEGAVLNTRDLVADILEDDDMVSLLAAMIRDSHREYMIFKNSEVVPISRLVQT